MSNSLVSVIIPTYNRADVICEAVDSVLSQTYSELELIVVDDGSKDQTPALMAKYGDRLKYIAKPNGGVADARNTGFRHAKGDFIAYLDSDDMWHNEKLQRYMQHATQEPGAPLLLFSDHVRVARDGTQTLHSSYYQAARRDFQANDRPLDAARKLALILEPYTFYPSTFLVSRSAHQHLTWRLHPKVNEDLFFILEASRYCKFLYIDEPLTIYRVRDDSISSSVQHSQQWSEYAFEIINQFRKLYALSDQEQALCGIALSRISTSLIKQRGDHAPISRKMKYLFHTLANRHTYRRMLDKAQKSTGM